MLSVQKDPLRVTCDECEGRVCDNEQTIRIKVAGLDVVLDPECAEELYTALGDVLERLTVSGLVERSLATADASGWNDDDDKLITRELADSQLASLAPVAQMLADVIEAVRKPEKADACHCLDTLGRFVRFKAQYGLTDSGSPVQHELGQPLGPSKTKLLSRLVLIVSEVGEAIEAVLKDDWEEFGKENADTLIRIGHMIGHYNRHAAAAGRPEIDLEAVTIAKDAYNRTRPYRHNKRA